MALHRALATKDVDRFVDLCSVRLEEQSRATGRTPEAVKELQRLMFRDALSRENVAPLDPDELEFRSGAGGRLVRVEQKGGIPPIFLTDGQTAVQMVLSHLASGFELVR
jgi:hypothetical protein